MARGPRTSIQVGIDASDAQAKLQRLASDFRTRGDEIDRVFGSRLAGSLDGVSTKLGGIVNLSGGLGSLSGAATAAGLGIAAIGAAAVVAGRQLSQFTAQQQALVTETRQLAERLGVSVEQFSALEQISKRYGATGEDLADVIKDLTVRAIENEKEFTDLGLSVRDANGRLLEGIPLFEQVSDGISRMESETRQAAAADILASDAGVRLIEVMRLSATERRALTDEVIAGGEAISAASAAINDEYIAATRDADQATDALFRTISEKLAPAFTEVAELTSNVARNLNRILTRGSMNFVVATPVVGPPPPGPTGAGQLAGTSGAGILDPSSFPAPPRAAGGRRNRRPANDEEPATASGFDLLADQRAAYNAMAEGHMLAVEAAQEAADQIIEIDRRTAEERAEIARLVALDRVSRELGAADTIVGAIGGAANSISQIEENLAGESASRSEELFYVQQAIAAVQAGVYTALAITRALAELGPIAGPIAAVAIGAAGAAQVAAILTASPTGGARPSSAGVAGISGVGSAGTGRASLPETAPRFAANDSAVRGGTTVNVVFNAPVDSRRAAREIRDTLRAG